VATYSLTASDPNGLLVGTYNGNSGVFVAESGSYTTSQENGAIDFIPMGLTNGSAATKVISRIPASRLAAFNSSTLIVTGGYPSHTNIISLNGASAIAHEVYYSTNKTFGSSDVDAFDGNAYVPGGFGSNLVYKVTSNGDTTALTVGSSTYSITNVGVNNSSIYAVDDDSGYIFKIGDISNPPLYPLVKTESVATEIAFSSGYAFVAVGSNKNAPGVYYFSLGSDSPIASRIGE
jgi:hypothetical protein